MEKNGRDEKLRVLHITLTARQGGGPEHLYQLVKGMKGDVDNYIASPEEPPYAPKFFDLVGSDQHIAVPHRKLSLPAFYSLWRFVRKHRINIVHSHGKGAGIYGRLLALMAGCKSVHTFHGIHLQYRRLVATCYLGVERLLGWRTHAFICVSEGEKALALDKGMARKDSCYVVENGVVLPETLACGKPDELFVVLHMSRFDYAKNSEQLVPVAVALRESPDFSKFLFVVLGEGEGMEKCKKAAGEAGVEEAFRFMGYQSEPRAFLRGETPLGGGRAGCYLSTSRWEGLPLAVLEAMAEGVPVVASDVVGNRDAVTDRESGLLFPIDRPDIAAKYLVELFENAGAWSRMAENAHLRVVSRFSVHIMARKTFAIYAQLS